MSRTATPEAPAGNAPELAAKLKALQDEIAALKAKPAPVQTLAASKGIEAWYEFKPAGGWKQVETKGLDRIDSHEDPRWEKQLSEPPYNSNVGGCLRVAEVTRVNGEVVKLADIMGGPCHMNSAREFLRVFKERVEAGEERPWDTEHFHRDEIAKAEKAKREGRLEDLETIRLMFAAAMKGGAESVVVTK